MAFRGSGFIPFQGCRVCWALELFSFRGVGGQGSRVGVLGEPRRPARSGVGGLGFRSLQGLGLEYLLG